MHYKTRQTWNEHNFGDQLPPDAEEINDKMFEEKVMPGSTKVRIDGIVRKDLGRKGEFIVYDYVLIGTDVNGRPLQRVKREGYWKKPVFQIVIDDGKPVEIARLDREEEMYDIPYSPENMRRIMEMDEFDSNYAMALSLSYGTWTCTNPDDFINVDKESLSLKLQQPTYVAGTR